MNKLTVHIISHSHWDREWYMPLEKHKLKLVDLINDNLEMLSENPEYRSFHLDGQTIVLDDYLEICPEKKKEIKRLVEEGRLVTVRTAAGILFPPSFGSDLKCRPPFISHSFVLTNERSSHVNARRNHQPR